MRVVLTTEEGETLADERGLSQKEAEDMIKELLMETEEEIAVYDKEGEKLSWSFEVDMHTKSRR